MLDEIKQRVCLANKELVSKGIVTLNWGNVSEIDDTRQFVVIKPSGLDYGQMSPNDMVVVALQTGKIVEGHFKPSTDTATHLELYKKFECIKGIAHTHSVNAVAFAQAGKNISALGTTHADYFYGEIPCTRSLTKEEVEKNYELSTGQVIVETFKNKNLNVNEVPGCLVFNHGPFVWGKNANEAVYHAVVLETVAEMALKTELLTKENLMPQYILEKHYQRKHGKNSYYGQKGL